MNDDDRNEAENGEEERAKSELEKFSLVEDILAGWEPKQRVPGGFLCSIDDLFDLVEKHSPSLFSSPSSLRSFISARPHLFRITKVDEVAVRFKEDRANYIQVVRFLRDSPSPVTFNDFIGRFWKEDAETKRLKEEEVNSIRDEEEKTNRWMRCGAPWMRSEVWRSIKRGGDGVFNIEGDTISLTPEALANDSFFNDIYLNYSEEVIRKQKEKIELSEDPKAVPKQRQCNSTQSCYLALATEVKPKYMKGLVFPPGPYVNEHTYILPNQIGATKQLCHCYEAMIIRAHDVIGDEQLKNRFRADEMYKFQLRLMRDEMKPEDLLSTGYRSSQRRPLLKFPNALRKEICTKLTFNDVQSEEYNRIKAKHEGMEVMVAQDTEGFSYYTFPTKELQFEWNARYAYEKLLVDELDRLITAGIKKRKEHGGESEENSYPIEQLLEDVKSRSITTPDADPLLDEETIEELEKEIAIRPHLYFIHNDVSVSLRNRQSIDRLLQCLDTQSLWTIETVRKALGEGKAGEEWKDEPIEQLYHNLLFYVMTPYDEYLTLAMRRTSDGLWMRENPAIVRGRSKIEMNRETEVEKMEQTWGQWIVNEDGRKTKGKGRREPRALSPVNDGEMEEDQFGDEGKEEKDEYEGDAEMDDEGDESLESVADEEKENVVDEEKSE